MALMVCSTAFSGLGRAQAKSLGHPDLPIAVIPHPFGLRSRDEVTQLAAQCVDDIARLLCETGAVNTAAPASRAPSAPCAELIDVPADLDELNRLFMQRQWSDGLPVIPPTAERVERMLACTDRARSDIVATIPPAFGAATVEHIAINAVMAGCYPEYLPVLIAAAEAMAVPALNLQSMQATTNPAAVWLIVNGPVARLLNVNAGGNCLGPGAWANATLGRAVRLIQQNIGGGLPGETDKATIGQPGKYTFCCAENEEANPWEPLHVEHGYSPNTSTVTMAGVLGTWNMNTHAKDSEDLLRVFADTMTFPCGSDVFGGGSPWVILAREHAHILKRDGFSKMDVKRRLWELTKLPASRLAAKDFARVQNRRRAELGEITRDTLLPISPQPEHINIIVAGGDGTHSVYLPASGYVRPVTREVIFRRSGN